MSVNSDSRYDGLREAWDLPRASTTSDYALSSKVTGAYAAHTRSRAPALVIPLSSLPSGAPGRRGSGFELVAHPALDCDFEGKRWTTPAAVLSCADSELLETFCVLAIDVADRVGELPSWQRVIDAVEEWQALLAPRGSPTSEAEIGLWGELWFIAQSNDVDRIIAGWRGPDGEADDFLIGGVAAEVKTSRQRRQHDISMSQVPSAEGLAVESWLLSFWVKVDPSGLTVPSLAAGIVQRANDRAAAMRRIAQAGFSSSARQEFARGLTLAAEPEWFPASAVPRVRAVDRGVTRVRYRVQLDEDQRAEPSEVERLAAHFNGSGKGIGKR